MSKKTGFKFGGDGTAANAIDLSDAFLAREDLSTSSALYGTVFFLDYTNTPNSFGNGGSYSTYPTVDRIGSALWKKVSSNTDIVSAGIKKDGTLWGWGSGSYSVNPSNTNVPVQIGSDSDWVDVLGGSSFNIYAIKKDGRVFAKGVDSQGALGRGYFLTTGTPLPNSGSFEPVVNITDAKKFISNNLVLDNDGNLWSWGSYQSTLGWGISGLVAHTPAVIMTNVSDAVLISGFVFAKDRSSGLWKGWGISYGTGAPVTSTYAAFIAPANAVTLSDEYQFTKFFNGGSQGYAIDDQGYIWGWGEGSAGSPITAVRFTPFKLTAAGTGWKEVATFGSYVFGLRYDGSIYRLGSDGVVGDQLNLPPVKSMSLSQNGFFLTY